MASRRFALQITYTLVLTLVLTSLCAAQTARVPQLPKPSGVKTATTGINATQGNWSQLAKLIATPGCCLGITANHAAISGDTVAVSQNPLGGQNSVVASVFVETAQGWRNSSTSATLQAPVPSEPYDSPIAIDGDTIVTTAPIGFGTNSGYAFVYVQPPGGWIDMPTPTAILTSSDHAASYGVSVSISGNTIVVGSDGFLGNTPGSAYVYVKPAAGWQNMTETAKLVSSDGADGDLFGWSVSANGGTIAVGAPQFASFQNPGPGKAYVFVEPLTGWTNMTQTAELTVTDSAPSDSIGFSVSLSGNSLLVGAPGFDDPLGAAFVYEMPVSGWTNMTQTATLKPGDGLTGANFGNSVALSGGIAVVGAPYRGHDPNSDEGGVYVFVESAGGWQDTASNVVLIGADAHWRTLSGYSVAIDGKTLVGTADLKSALDTAYVFGLP